MDKNLNKIIQELSDKYKLPKYKVELIVMSQFQTIRDIIQEGEYESIRLMHLGRFKVSEYHIKKRNEERS
jgi:nucleoid DNA-binding protein